MKITKLEHSGVGIEKEGQVLVFDPVEFAEKLPGFSGVVGVVITHMHNDHCQPDKIARILKANPGATVMTTEDNAEGLAEALKELLGGDSVDVVTARPGEKAQVGDFELRFFGGEHAAIMPGSIPCQNLGVVVDDEIVNPGDSFDVAGVDTAGKILLAPIAAPWCKISEVANFVREAKPAVVIPVHDAVLSELGLGYSVAHIANVCEGIGAKFEGLKPGESAEV